MSKKVAILATNGFEESELKSPKDRLEKEGWTADIISLKAGSIKSWSGENWGDSYNVDKTLDEVSASDYHALVLPGGVANPDLLRREEKAISFVKDFFEQKKPVAAICHAPQLLINAEVVEGRILTSFPSIRKDLENAGAKWVDKEVVVDNGFVTSRSPEDLDAFNSKMVEEIKEGKHELQQA
ncbi:type 1 glutamine amidotransferase [Flavobacterium arcticum]|uniref:Type 1 glutamine amidotransferase n=1 Tax=Flavobacterium arcticum TaxID=1784713 RepID=A0A345HDR9_9FLAO|nr:type 1 glutamine amidotransferase domain-containing protein [Flavobacterium arcticum]AXG74729.1 type 1 glutamine amidotransferase [Flavobacterium arcticum]KAF2509772.1 type 1 glutamine amidotransferase [Flavobacterium arcticum]